MDVTGQWFYARWLGGGCRLAQAEGGDEAVGDKAGIIFCEGKLIVLLHCSSDGWWEAPPDIGLRLRRVGPHLVLQRRRGSKGRLKQFRATTSSCSATYLCYKSALLYVFMNSPKVDVPSVQAAPPLKEAPAVSETGIANAGAKESDPDDELWPEPEAEGMPEQPSTAQEANAMSLLLNGDALCEELPETISDEKLVQHPQIVSYCLGVTSLAHSPARIPRSVGDDTTPGSQSSFFDLPVSPKTEPSLHPTRAQSETMSEVCQKASSSTRPTEQSEVASDTSDVNLDIVEERIAVAVGERVVMEGVTDVNLDQVERRVVAQVSDLRTTIHGLLAVPEDAELPDVPNPVAPSKSDSSLLHGSVQFDGDPNCWQQDQYEIPDEVLPDLQNRENNPLFEKRSDAGSLWNSAAFQSPPDDDDDEEEDPRLRPNPLVRSHKVSGNLSTAPAKSEEQPSSWWGFF